MSKFMILLLRSWRISYNESTNLCNPLSAPFFFLLLLLITSSSLKILAFLVVFPWRLISGCFPKESDRNPMTVYKGDWLNLLHRQQLPLPEKGQLRQHMKSEILFRPSLIRFLVDASLITKTREYMDFNAFIRSIGCNLSFNLSLDSAW